VLWSIDRSIALPPGIPEVSDDHVDRLVPEISQLRAVLSARSDLTPSTRTDVRPLLDCGNSPTHAFLLATSLRRKCVDAGLLSDAPKKCLFTEKRLKLLICEAMVGNFVDPFVYDENTGQ
jgi:hypothetical protein